VTILSGIGATGPYSRFCELNGEQSVAMNAEIATLSEVAHLLLLSKFMQIMQLMVRCQHIKGQMKIITWYYFVGTLCFDQHFIVLANWHQTKTLNKQFERFQTSDMASFCLECNLSNNILKSPCQKQTEIKQFCNVFVGHVCYSIDQTRCKFIEVYFPYI